MYRPEESDRLIAGRAGHAAIAIFPISIMPLPNCDASLFA